MKKLILTMTMIATSLTILANPRPNCYRPPHPHNPPPHHHYHHNRTAEWIGVGLLGAITLNNIVNPPRETVVVQQPVVIQQQKPTAIWIPETKTITYDSKGNQIVTIIPGHWEYR